MVIEHIKKCCQKTSSWSGGTTTELYIYPETAAYTKRDFLFRISSATVEAETSEFTKLPGVERTLMLLTGQLTLQHEGREAIQLTPYGKNSFSGDWETVSSGKDVSDFNLMTREGCEGAVEVCCLHPFQAQKLTLRRAKTCKRTMYGFYALDDGLLFESAAKHTMLRRQDFLLFVFEDSDEDTAVLDVIPQTGQAAHVIETRVCIC